MQLSDLLQNIYNIPETMDCQFKQLLLDSRLIQQNDIFCAIKGTEIDGRQFIAQAINNGAAAVLVDSELKDELNLRKEQQTLLVPIQNLRERLGELAARFYHYPAKNLKLIGVTGTNGKTSCTHYMAQLLEAEKIACGIVGTLGYGRFDQLQHFGLTTPDAISLQAILQKFYLAETKTVCMEVSSHSIDQHRINALDFDVGLFTNLSQDHLDYHGSMAAYAAVKRQFLTAENTKAVVINRDDHYGRQWINELQDKKIVYGYSTKIQEKNTSIPMVTATQMNMSLAGITAYIKSPWGEGQFTSNLIGDFNLSNILASLTALCVYGLPFDSVLRKLPYLKAVPGRMQTLGGGAKPLVVVDYSHTPDALEKALYTLRKYTSGRLFCIFGCGGNRDQGKRPQMAEIAEHYADTVIVTNDNPRHERPEAIAVEIMHGFARPDTVMIELNRSKAIQKSIQLANAQDCILIAGKGAEHYQQVGDEKIPFDDVETVREFL